jgi:RNA polymerase sigma-19 factor, ECF subfamily
MSHAPHPDLLAELYPRVRAGDVAAFEQIFKSLHAPLCEVVDSYVRSQDVAEEIVQDLFFVLWTTRNRLPPARSFRAYLFAAARNRALHHLRHRAVVRRWAERTRWDADIAPTGSPVPRPDQVLQASEQTAAIRRAIAQLPPRARTAFLLCWEHEMSHAAAATAMGISVKGVEKLVGSARAKLRVLLGDLADSLSD